MTTYDPRLASGQPADPVPPSNPNPPGPNPKTGRQQDPPKALSASKGPIGTIGHPQCTAMSKRTGERCGCYPMHGTTVCNTHGGMAPQVKAAAARRLATQEVEAEANAVLAHQGIEGALNPLEEVARLTAETRATLDAVAARVNSLAAIRYSASGSGTEQTRAEMVLLGQYQDRLSRLLDMMMRWDFDNRRLLLQEYLTKTSGLVLGTFLDDLMASLRDELITVGADALEEDFPTVWRDAISRLFPAAFRALGKRLKEAP